MVQKLDPETIYLSTLCDKNKNAIDVGANKGVYVELISPHCKHLYAFEPLPKMAKLLSKKYNRNKNITIFEIALSNKKGTTNLFTPRYTNPDVNRDSFVEGWSSIQKNYSDLKEKYPDKFPEIRKIEIKTDKLDNQNLENLGFIKIDVEGAEIEVLRGAKKLIEIERPNFLIEIEERHRKNCVNDVTQYLKKFSYDCFYILDNKLQSFENFSIETMQQGKLFPGPIDPKYKHYIYNFIFIPKENELLRKKLFNKN